MNEPKLGFRKTGQGESLGVVVPEGTPEAPTPSHPTSPDAAPKTGPSGGSGTPRSRPTGAGKTR